MKPEQQTECYKEAKIMKKLDHPNIVRFREVYRTKMHKLCIVMEYADGGDLSSEIKRRAERKKLFEE